MARRVFFSFEYEHDVSRAMVVRNSWVTQGKQAAGFVDAADFEQVQTGGDASIKRWIREQLEGTSVTVVLVGSHTCTSKYVRYEIERERSQKQRPAGNRYQQDQGSQRTHYETVWSNPARLQLLSLE